MPAVKVDIETSSKEKLTLENNVAHWKANYESLKKSHDALRDEATRKNEEVSIKHHFAL